MRQLTLLSAGPRITVQDGGRPGWAAQGLSRGGAADRLAWLEGAALLGQPPLAALEIQGPGAQITASGPLRIALTGSALVARVDGRRLPVRQVARIEAGQRLDLGPVDGGGFAMLSLGGGIETPRVMGSRAAHLTAGLGRRLSSGDVLPLGPDPAAEAPLLRLPPESPARTLRWMPGPQTGLFPEELLARVEAQVFRRGTSFDRQGLRLDHDGAGFRVPGQLSLASAPVTEGDIQIAGDGAPVVLLAECQTMGGYPRLGTILPCDLPLLLRAPADAPLRLQRVSVAQADALWTSEAEVLRRLKAEAQPVRRDPHDIPDLAGYQLISGVWGADPDEGWDPP